MISRFQGRCQQTILMRVCVNNSLTSGSKIFPNIAMYFIGSEPSSCCNLVGEQLKIKFWPFHIELVLIIHNPYTIKFNIELNKVILGTSCFGFHGKQLRACKFRCFITTPKMKNTAPDHKSRFSLTVITRKNWVPRAPPLNGCIIIAHPHLPGEGL